MIILVLSFIHQQFFRCWAEQSGAAEACWAHNPEVRRSKLCSAKFFIESDHGCLIKRNCGKQYRSYKERPIEN